MDFGISPKLERLLAQIQDFMEAEVLPLEPAFLTQPFDSLLPDLEARRQKVKDLGWWAPFLPQAYGGMGLSLAQYAHVSEVLGRSPLGHYLFNCQAPDVGNMELLIHAGTEPQKNAYLRPLARGEIRSCFAMTEPDFPGSNPTWMGTMAERDGDDYVINGRKWFTSAADGAAFTIVMAVTNPEAHNRHQRASQIIVSAGTPGYKLVHNLSVMGDRGVGYASHGELLFDDCRVPQHNRLGPEGAGFALAQERLGPGRIHHCMRWIGICERAFDMICQRALSRQLTPGNRLADHQIPQVWIAECRAEIDAARLMVLQAAWKMDREGASAARVEISTIKFFVAGVLQRVLDRAIQAHGAVGVTDQTPLAYWYRHERAARIYDGPDEVHKIAVARRILGRYQ